MSVGFADTDFDSSNHIEGQTELGRIYIPEEGVELDNGIDGITVRYEKHPWIEKFEVDGIRPARPRRTGFGNKGPKSFVKSLNTIYSRAFDDYYEFEAKAKDRNKAKSEVMETGHLDAEAPTIDWVAYFEHVTDAFCERAKDPAYRKMAKKYIGFAENMWREGDEFSYNIAMGTVVPRIRENESMGELFDEVITEEFSEYLKTHIDER